MIDVALVNRGNETSDKAQWANAELTEPMRHLPLYPPGEERLTAGDRYFRRKKDRHGSILTFASPGFQRGCVLHAECCSLDSVNSLGYLRCSCPDKKA